MHFTAVEQFKEQQMLKTPFALIEANKIVSKFNINPKWRELIDACVKIPEGYGMQVSVPEGIACHQWSNVLRAMLSGAKRTMDWKYSIRQAKDEKSVFILKVEEWKVGGQTVSQLRKENGIN